jgi:hypothetical protein
VKVVINMTKKWNVRVWCLTASYNYTVVASDEQTAIDIVRGKVMPDMKRWHFSVRPFDNDGNEE